MKKNEINPLRNWAINLIPLPCPEIIDINIKDIKNQFSTNYVAGTVDLAVLEQPVLDASKFKKLQPKSISSYLISFKIDISENKFLFDYQDIECISYRFHAVEIPKIRTLQISESWEYPRIVDLFFNLKQPLRDGKSYVRYKDTYEQTSLLSEKADGDGEREINSETPQVKYIFTKKQPYKKEKIIDLFDLLLPYLQPPIDAILDMPLQWPPDRRPYDYQLTGVKFLAERPNALLGDEMGLGKTVQTIVALQMLYRKGQIRRTLILCPKSLLATWERELNKWAPEFYVTKIRGDRNSRFKLWESSSPIFITTYDTWREDAEQICENKGADTFQIAILDEIQRIKNPGTKINKAVTMLNPKFRWGLSGTPLENAISDVVTIFSFLKPRLFNTKNQVSGETVRNTIAP